MRTTDYTKATLLRLLLIDIILFLCLCSLATAATVNSDSDSDAFARKMIDAQGCKACHTLSGTGGTTAISLEAAGLKLTADEIRQQLTNQKKQHGDGRIADFSHLSTIEIEVLVKFLKQGP